MDDARLFDLSGMTAIVAGASSGLGVMFAGTRWALRRRPEELPPTERASLALLEQENLDLYRGYLLQDELRAVYRLRTPDEADSLLPAWTEMAAASGLASFVKLAATIEGHREGADTRERRTDPRASLAAWRLPARGARLRGELDAERVPGWRAGAKDRPLTTKHERRGGRRCP
jgi:transposase